MTEGHASLSARRAHHRMYATLGPSGRAMWRHAQEFSRKSVELTIFFSCHWITSKVTLGLRLRCILLGCLGTQSI